MNTESKAWQAFAEYYRVKDGDLELFPKLVKEWNYWSYVWNLATNSNESVHPDTGGQLPSTVRGWLHKLGQSAALAWSEGYEKGIYQEQKRTTDEKGEFWYGQGFPIRLNSSDMVEVVTADEVSITGRALEFDWCTTGNSYSVIWYRKI